LTSQASVNEATTLMALNKTKEKLVHESDKMGVNLNTAPDYPQEQDKPMLDSTTVADSDSSISVGHPGNQSSNMLITTMDSDAMEGYTISQPYSQRRAGAEKWHITRQAKSGEKE